MFIKRGFIVGSFFIVSSFSFAIPVINIPQVVENVLTEIRDNYETLVTWEREITQWEEEYKAITEFKLGGDTLSKLTQVNEKLAEYGLDMGSLDLDNPKSQIGVYAKDLFKTLTVFDDCNYDYMTDKQKEICKHTILREAEEISTVKKFSEEITGLLEKLNELNTQLGGGEKGTSSNNKGGLDEGAISSLTQDYSSNSEGSLDSLSEEEKTAYETLKNSNSSNQQEGSIFDNFSGEDKAAYDGMKGDFDSAESETDTDENSIKLSQDVAAGVKIITTTVKAMRVRYKILKSKNEAKEAIDRRQKKQIYMEKYQLDNVNEFYKKRAL